MHRSSMDREEPPFWEGTKVQPPDRILGMVRASQANSLSRAMVQEMVAMDQAVPQKLVSPRSFIYLEEVLEGHRTRMAREPGVEPLA